MSAWGIITLRMLDALEQYGPMTNGELCRHLGLSKETSGSILSRLKRPTRKPEGPPRIHICAWVDDAEGQRKYLRAAYAAGEGKDAPKPSRRQRVNESKRRYRHRMRQIQTHQQLWSTHATASR